MLSCTLGSNTDTWASIRQFHASHPCPAPIRILILQSLALQPRIRRMLHIPMGRSVYVAGVLSRHCPMTLFQGHGPLVLRLIGHVVRAIFPVAGQMCIFESSFCPRPRIAFFGTSTKLSLVLGIRGWCVFWKASCSYRAILGVRAWVNSPHTGCRATEG